MYALQDRPIVSDLRRITLGEESDTGVRSDFSRISQMHMRERSTAHAQTKKGLKNQRLVISREIPDFLADFLISTGLCALVEHTCHHQGADI